MALGKLDAGHAELLAAAKLAPQDKGIRDAMAQAKELIVARDGKAKAEISAGIKGAFNK